MSNHEKATSKVISIKKLSDFYPEQFDQKSHTISEQQAQAASSLKVNQLQQQIADLNNQKEKVLADLRETIVQEKEAWEQEKEKERQAVLEQGYQEGYEAGATEAQAAWEAELTKVNELADQANEDYFRTIEKHEEAIIQLAITSAEKIVKHELQENKEQFIEIVQEAIKDLEDYSYIHIYVHPDEYEHVVNLKAELGQVIGMKELISIYTDSELEKYGCLIKHSNGQIDASIDLQLRQIKNALAEKVMEQS